MRSDTRIQLKAITAVNLIALGILAIYLWPKSEAAGNQCEGEIYYMPSDYRVVGFESIAHLADLNDKMSDPVERKKAVFDPVEALVYESPLWIQPTRPESSIQRPRYSDMPIAGGYWIGDSVIQVPVVCSNDVSEPKIVWMMLLGILIMWSAKNGRNI